MYRLPQIIDNRSENTKISHSGMMKTRYIRTVFLSWIILFFSAIVPSNPSSDISTESSRNNVEDSSLYTQDHETKLDEESRLGSTEFSVNNPKSIFNYGTRGGGFSETGEMQQDGVKDGVSDVRDTHFGTEHKNSVAKVEENSRNHDKETRNKPMNVDTIHYTTAADFVIFVNTTLSDVPNDREKVTAVEKSGSKPFLNELKNDKLKKDDSKVETYLRERHEILPDMDITNTAKLPDSHTSSFKCSYDSWGIYPCGKENTEFCLDVGAYTGDRVTPPQGCGLMATDNHLCQRKNLIVTTGAYIDQSIIEHCRNLTKITLEGKDWDCSKPDDWLWLQNPTKIKNTYLYNDCQLSLNATAAFCREDHRLQLISTVMDKHINSTCPDGCLCKKRGGGSFFGPEVNCTGRNFTDRSLPDQYSPYTLVLHLKSNKLVSTDVVTKKLSRLLFLVVLHLDENQLDSIPSELPFPYLIFLSMTNNSITELNSAAMIDIINRPTKPTVDIRNNTLKCGCYMYWVKKNNILLRESRSVFQDIWNMRCEEGNHSIRIWHYDTTHCKPKESMVQNIDFTFIVLGGLNVIFIYFTIDLIIITIRLRKHSDIVTTPKIHSLIKFIFTIIHVIIPCSQKKKNDNEPIQNTRMNSSGRLSL